MVTELTYQEFIPYKEQKSIRYWIKKARKFKKFKNSLRFKIPSFTWVKDYVFRRLISKTIKANLLLRGLIERVTEIDNSEIKILYPDLVKSLEAHNNLEDTIESFKENNPLFYKEYNEMVSLIEDLVIEFDYKLNPDSYTEEITQAKKAFNQLKAVESGSIKSMPLESIL